MKYLIKTLEDNCSPYISALKNCNKGSLLLRGANPPIDDIYKYESRLSNRRPLNTPIKTHDLINSIFFKEFGWNIRNGVFCYGWNILSDELPYDLGYGTQHMIFPIGNFRFVYSPDHFDFYNFVSETKVDRRTLEKEIFKDGTLNDALSTGEHEYDYSNEISLNVSTYFMLNLKYKNDIIKMIWD